MNTTGKDNLNGDVSQDVVNLVVARLRSIPNNVEVSIGNSGSYSIDDLIERVQRQDEVGKQMIDMQMRYLRSFQTQ